jgi:UDP-N-acetylglucosamine diphosphorylase/glucosamine-1-phosphate N-acetyltransferase
VGVIDGEVAFAVLPPEELAGLSFAEMPGRLARWQSTLPAIEAGGTMIRHLWEPVDLNGEMIARDSKMGAAPPPWKGDAPAVVGPREALLVAASARIDPHVVADTTGGPVVIDEGAHVLPFSRLEGPCFIGPRSQVHGAKVRAGTTLGPECRVGGEVECSIVQGFSNKYHDGFLGHAYVGSWVNLGAGTQNSDLRNDYGEVRVMVDGRLTGTGRHKVGCFLGDHTKAAIGCLLNTGTSAGPFAQLLPSGGLLPRHVPAFTTAAGGGLMEQGDLADLLAAADRVMRRRGKSLTPAFEAMYRAVFTQTARERQQALRESERRRLRASA